VAFMSTAWPALAYEQWRATCDTLHAHTQVLGKLAVKLAPPEPELQHAALRLTARGWETLPLPAPDRSGSLVVVLDLRQHEAVVEHSGGRTHRVPLTPDRAVGAVTREVLAAVRDLGGPVEIDPTPQEVPWHVPLDSDDEHATYDPGQVASYFAAATQAALVLAAYRAPYRGRSTPVNAWWGSFDLAVSLFSGLPADPPSEDFIMRNAMDAQEVAVGWWPGDARYGKARSTPTRTRPRPTSRARPCPRRPPTGTTCWGSTSWTGTTSGRPRIRTPPRWSSPVRPSGTPVPSAGGTAGSRPPPTAPRRPSDDSAGHVDAARSVTVHTCPPAGAVSSGQARAKQ